MNISVIAGARPNFMKIAPVVRALRAVDLPSQIIHTGQHYDERMSQSFFDELSIPRPHINLGVGSNSAVRQVSEIMRKLEHVWNEARPCAVLVVGDVNSTLAASLTASKLGIPLAHVEAGLRSFDRTMPEEINRIVTDALSQWLFTSEPAAAANLEREGIPTERVHFVGNVMIDTLLDQLERARNANYHRQWNLPERGYVLLTLHRPSNVDDRERLTSILRAVHAISRRLPVIFPIHPRTKSRLEGFGAFGDPALNGYLGIEPVGYLTMLGLMDRARFVMTDSGGVQEETTALGVPCLTLRENTERPITIEQGSNRLVGWESEKIVEAASDVASQTQRRYEPPEKWDGRAAERVAERLCADLSG